MGFSDLKCRLFYRIVLNGRINGKIFLLHQRKIKKYVFLGFYEFITIFYLKSSLLVNLGSLAKKVTRLSRIKHKIKLKISWEIHPRNHKSTENIIRERTAQKWRFLCSRYFFISFDQLWGASGLTCLFLWLGCIADLTRLNFSTWFDKKCLCLREYSLEKWFATATKMPIESKPGDGSESKILNSVIDFY